MIEGAWSRFLEYAAHARTKPTFEAEERQPRLETAAKLRRSLAAAREGGDWQPLMREALRLPSPDAFESPRYNLAPPRPRRRLNEWAERDAESLRAALMPFLDTGLDPVERFAGFAEAAARERVDETATLILGSMLAFSVDPQSLPIVRALNELHGLLGVTAPQLGEPLADQYAAHLDFAREVQARMQARSIPILDMVDVQSLMLIGIREQGLWASDPPDDWVSKSARPVPPGSSYLAASTLYLNDASYLREWIEFHRLVGFERFFLYDNGSSDNHLEVLAPYMDDGIVTVRRWWPSPPDHREVFDDCLSRHREDARWIAFIDVDEFLFSPTGRTVAGLLREYEPWPGVGVNWAMFSHAGHRTRPDALVIESYRLRDRAEPGWIKCVVDPMRTERCESAHLFKYDYGLTVDENKWPIAQGQTKSTSFDLLRLNHYASRSEEEALAKIRIPGWKGLRQWRLKDVRGELDLVPDDAIMKWAPELRGSLADKAAR